VNSTSTSSMEPFRIHSLDGGGAKGFYTRLSVGARSYSCLSATRNWVPLLKTEPAELALKNGAFNNNASLLPKR
jgi:hypothetical protein